MEEVNDPMDLEKQPLSSPPAEKHGSVSSARQIMQTAVHAIKPLQTLLVGSSPDEEENARNEDIEQDSANCVNSDQTAPLLETVNDVSHSREPLRRLVHVLFTILAFKAHEEHIPEDDEGSDSLSTSSEHHISPLANNQLESSPRKMISTIVHKKDLVALRKFGGLGRVELALRMDLGNGISENEAQIRTGQHAPSISQTPTHTYFHLVLEEVKKKTILLVLVGLAISTAFEINQEGLKYGCYDGAVLLIVIILLVFLASIRKYWQEQRAQKKLQDHQFIKRKVGKVQVKRESYEPKFIYKSELVWGDILLLKKGDEVPCDGLFVGGEPLELDYGSESCIINEHNPFLTYGERVIKGAAQMVVTSTYMGTGWSEMMSKGCGDPNARFKLEFQLDKLNTRMHDIQIVISILLVLVMILRSVAGHVDNENGYRPESMAEPTTIRRFEDTFEKIVKQSTYTTKVLTRLLSVSLVGLTVGVPFVVSLAIVYWNDKTLFGKGMEQDPHGIAKMAHVTRICTDTFITEDVMEVEKVFVGGETINKMTTLSPDVIEVLRDGAGTLNQKSFPRVKDMFGFKSEKRWKTVDTKGAKSFQEPCGVLMRGNEENEGLVWHFNGPVNEILNMCKDYYDIRGQKANLDDETKQKFIHASQDNQHKHKLTTIALACKPVRAQTEDVEDLILIALLGLKIEKKEETNAQVRELRARGIETVIVSSKSLSVMQDIARKCAVLTNGDLEFLKITGKELRSYTDKERLEKVENIRVLSEALPSDKVLLVETLMEKSKAVVFLGQRTDEAPSLKRAHVGIVMGTWSSEKAIENCGIIMDGSFVDLISMVDNGKCIYYNVQSFLQIVMNTTISCTLIGFIEIAAFGDASLTLFQLAFVNLAVTILGGLALLTKASIDVQVMSDPICCKQSVISAEMARNIVFQVLYLAICSVIVQVKGSVLLDPSQDTKTVVSNILIFCQLFNLFNAREIQKINFFRGIHRHKEFWIAIVVFIVLHALTVMVQDIFGYGTRMELKLWVCCVILGALSWLVDSFGKCISWFIKLFVNRLSQG